MYPVHLLYERLHYDMSRVEVWSSCLDYLCRCLCQFNLILNATHIFAIYVFEVSCIFEQTMLYETSSFFANWCILCLQNPYASQYLLFDCTKPELTRNFGRNPAWLQNTLMAENVIKRGFTCYLYISKSKSMITVTKFSPNQIYDNFIYGMLSWF